MPDEKTVADRIKDILAQKKIKKGDFYKAMLLTPQSIRNWGIRESLPAVDTALKIAEFLGVSVKWLITGEEEPGLSHIEQDLLAGFRQLDERDQSDVLGNIKMKLEKAKGIKHGTKPVDKQAKAGEGHRVRGKGA
jgi:transcriptional regulator with XRE-family HTH domain